MYLLRTLGGLALERDGVRLDHVAVHRKALALLAMVAAHGSLGRDRIMALLWPESDGERARNSLNQAVHLLRRHLSEPELFLGTSELRLNPERIESDVELFARAIRGGDLVSAVAHYEGPFLDGVFLEGTPEFEHWLDARRAELGRQFAGALEELAEEAEARGDAVAAVEWWRRLQGTDPLNSRVALRLIRALDASGDRSSALRCCRIHELLLQEELGIALPPEVREIAQRLRDVLNTDNATVPDRSLRSPRPPDRTTTGAGTREGFVPDVSVAAGEESADSTGDVGSASDTPATANRLGPVRPRRGILFLALAVLAGVVATAFVVGLRGSGGSNLSSGAGAPQAGSLEGDHVETRRISLAVLPFADMSPDGDQAYLADGITEELLNTLAKHLDLRIPARSSSFYFKGRNLPIREIGAQLGVDAVLEGSVRKSGDRIRITAQLVDAREDRHLWSETYDRDLADVFAVQTEIAEIVAEALRVRLIPHDGARDARPTGNPMAHDLYLRGLFHWNRRSGPDLGLAIGFFEEATRLDPAYARAWAGLALTYAVIPIGFTPVIPQEEAWARMEETAARALALDPTLAEVHAALGLGYHFQWRWDDAEAEYLRALALNPGYATAHQWYGLHQAKTGRPEEGVRSMRRALELDPLSLVINNDVGLALLLDRDFVEARTQWERTVEMDPGFAIPIYFLHRLHLLEGRLTLAADWGRRWAELTGAVAPEDVVTLSFAPGEPALREEALAILHRWAAAPSPRLLDIVFYAAMLRARDLAFEALEEGLRRRAPKMAQVGMSPWLDPLRGDPRMDRIIREVGLQ